MEEYNPAKIIQRQKAEKVKQRRDEPQKLSRLRILELRELLVPALYSTRQYLASVANWEILPSLRLHANYITTVICLSLVKSFRLLGFLRFCQETSAVEPCRREASAMANNWVQVRPPEPTLAFQHDISAPICTFLRSITCRCLVKRAMSDVMTGS